LQIIKILVPRLSIKLLLQTKLQDLKNSRSKIT
jgi:hypothetical protein